MRQHSVLLCQTEDLFAKSLGLLKIQGWVHYSFLPGTLFPSPLRLKTAAAAICASMQGQGRGQGQGQGQRTRTEDRDMGGRAAMQSVQGSGGSSCGSSSAEGDGPVLPEGNAGFLLEPGSILSLFVVFCLPRSGICRRF